MLNNKAIIIGAVVASIMVTGAYATGENVVTSKSYVDTEVAKKQAKLLGNGSNVAVTYPTSLGGTPTSRTINTSVGSSTSDTGLVETGAINTALNNKQQKLTGAQNTVITYGATPGGATGSKAVYNASGSYNANALAETGHVNDTVVRAFNAHLTCAEHEDPNDDTSNCLLYDINTLSGTYVPHGN